MVERITSIMETFAFAAESVEQFRLAQTWRILGYAMSLLLNRRAQYHLQSRLGHFAKVPAIAKPKDSMHPSELLLLKIAKNGIDDQSPRRGSAVSALMERGSVTGRSLLSEEIESTSNVPTPVAKPVREDDS